MLGTRKDTSKKYELAKTSLIFQTKEFFENSTLHGVRYIAEVGRPQFDRFLWICCTLVGATVTLIIIVSLWEKFQTNPTITGLDTDFHNWDVEFPGISVCVDSPVDVEAVDALIEKNYSKIANDELPEYLALVGGLNHFYLFHLENTTTTEFPTTGFRDIALQVAFRCENVIADCRWKTEPITIEQCCDWFKPVFTEVGLCFTFNVRPSAGLMNWKGEILKNDNFKVKAIYETDPGWSLAFSIANAATNPASIYIQSSDELPGIDLNPHHIFDARVSKLAFSAKTTYTTTDTEQLSIKQRHCVFPYELKLISDDIYTYGGCMRDCRIKLSYKYCGCIPYFYKPLPGYPFCDLKGYRCLAKYVDEVMTKVTCNCELGCQNTVYEVEKLTEKPPGWDGTLDVSFVSWPMIRYKREVLFGWVDLLVSFGGIAGLFLGFSLLSGVEIIYYFTLRACCMLQREKNTLEKLKKEYDLIEKPPLDLSLTPYFMNKPKTSAQLHNILPYQQ